MHKKCGLLLKLLESWNYLVDTDRSLFLQCHFTENGVNTYLRFKVLPASLKNIQTLEEQIDQELKKLLKEKYEEKKQLHQHV